MVQPLRRKLCEKLELFAPAKETWQDRLHAENDTPLLPLIDRYAAQGNGRMVATLQSMAAYESCKKLMQRLQLLKSHVHYLRLVAHRELNKVYHCAA